MLKDNDRMLISFIKQLLLWDWLDIYLRIRLFIFIFKHNRIFQYRIYNNTDIISKYSSYSLIHLLVISIFNLIALFFLFFSNKFFPLWLFFLSYLLFLLIVFVGFFLFEEHAFSRIFGKSLIFLDFL